jgi:hypothetical protein
MFLYVGLFVSDPVCVQRSALCIRPALSTPVSSMLSSSCSHPAPIGRCEDWRGFLSGTGRRIEVRLPICLPSFPCSHVSITPFELSFRRYARSKLERKRQGTSSTFLEPKIPTVGMHDPPAFLRRALPVIVPRAQPVYDSAQGISSPHARVARSACTGVLLWSFGNYFPLADIWLVVRGAM